MAKTVDFGLIHDETNPTAPCLTTPVIVPHLSSYLVCGVEQVEVAQTNETSIPATTAKAHSPLFTTTNKYVRSLSTIPPSVTILYLWPQPKN